MRMKKIILIAAVAIAAAACSKTFETNLATEKAIGFGTWAENMTKAHDGTWANDESFTVYGTKTVPVDANEANDVTSTVFDGVEVSYATSTSAWSYTNLKYWDLSAKNYTFYAFLPTSKLGSGNVSGQFTSSAVTFEHPTGIDEDVLVATKYSRTRSSSELMPTTEVQLAFNHMASLVDIKVKKDQTIGDDAVVSVTAAKLTGIKSVGTLAVTGYDGDGKPTYTGCGWSPDATPTVAEYAASATLPFEVPAESTYKTDGTVDSTTPATPYNGLIENYLLMPQTFAADAQKFVFSYTITAPDGASAEYNNISVDLINFMTTDTNTNAGTAVGAWMPGYHYTFYVTIGAKAITFSATVNPWEEAAGYHYLVK